MQEAPTPPAARVEPSTAPGPEGPASTPSSPPLETPAPAADRPRLRRAVILAVGLFAIAIAAGALVQRELYPGAVARGLGDPGAAALDKEAPGWVSDFATAFCDGDGTFIAARLGGQLSASADDVDRSFRDREWSCVELRYLGAGTNPNGSFYVYVTVDREQNEQWWVFTVNGERVVGID